MKRGSENKQLESDILRENVKGCISYNAISTTSDIGAENTQSNESQLVLEEEYADILLKVFQVKSIIEEIKKILKKMRLTKLIIMIDDISEINTESLRLFVDTIVAP